MERKKITIKDSRKKPMKVVYDNHPFFNDIANSLMPDEFREIQKKSTNLDDLSFIEEDIKRYYEQIEEAKTFDELTVIEILVD